ncbi:tetratricopeptide repeat protein [Roseimaritima sediminicola]|uniref:tetratricopeptide repeat protein n=1 Tax=Roseimaritima sediminicola TaxID=2662066 RepID=UPI001F1A7616|nr:tetratricopeptide repeat protein [Roseimaritima sediminicola]
MPPFAQRCPRLLAAILVLPLAGLLSGCQWASNGQNAQGTQLYEQGQYTAAMQHFQKAIETTPTDADGYYNLAATTHRLGIQRQDAALLEQAEALYNQCLDHDANHVECHRGLAVLLADTNRPDKAFTLMKNWASQNPTLADARIELARLYEEYGDPATARRYLEDAVQQDPNSARAWLALGKLRESSGELAQALANYQRSYSLNSMQPMVVERIAYLNRQLSDSYNTTLSTGGTRMAQPGTAPAVGTRRY